MSEKKKKSYAVYALISSFLILGIFFLISGLIFNIWISMEYEEIIDLSDFTQELVNFIFGLLIGAGIICLLIAFVIWFADPNLWRKQRD